MEDDDNANALVLMPLRDDTSDDEDATLTYFGAQFGLHIEEPFRVLRNQTQAHAEALAHRHNAFEETADVCYILLHMSFTNERFCKTGVDVERTNGIQAVSGAHGCTAIRTA